MNRPTEERLSFQKVLSSPEFQTKLQDINSGIEPKRLCKIFLMKDAQGEFCRSGYCVSNESLYAAILQCAAYGVEPIHQRVYLIPKGNQLEVKLSYLGLLYIVYKGANIILEAQNVFEDDEFSIDYGSKEKFIHKPSITGVQGFQTLVGTYCWYVTDDGNKRFVWLPKSEIEQIRKASRGGTVWSQYTLEMCKKSALRRALKSILQLVDTATDSDIALSQAIEADDEVSFETDKTPAKSAREALASKLSVKE